jgi:tetratricopeptide (TPR) repeat protein
MGEGSVAFDLIWALARHSDKIEQFDELARTSFELKHYLLATELSEKALGLSRDPKQIYNIQSNLVNSYAHANYPEKALDVISTQEKVIPFDRDRDLKKAYSLFLMGKRDEAEKILRENLVNPYTSSKIKTEINFNLGTYEMYKDNFHEGLYRFLFYGREMGNWNKPKLPYKFWDGCDISGKTLIIMTEAGIGDEFINVRFMNNLKSMGVTPIWLTERGDIANIFRSSGFGVINDTKNIIDNGSIYWCHSMDLPVLMNLEYKDLWGGSYITPPTKSIVPDYYNTDKLKVGLRWQGNIHYDNDLHRSLNLSELYEVASSDKAQLYSLQRDEGAEEVYRFDDIIPLHEFSMKTFEDTLFDISNLDLVITSCTSIAHASAAMGKETIVMVPMSAYYVWCNTWGEKSPWYGDNITVLRQVKPRCWKEPLQRLREILHVRYGI